MHNYSSCIAVGIKYGHISQRSGPKQKAPNGTSFVMKHLHRMKVPIKQEHLPRKVQDRTISEFLVKGYHFTACLASTSSIIIMNMNL